MEVKRYLFQSPYNSPIQMGREDPSTKTQERTSELLKNTDQELKKAQTFEKSTEETSTNSENSENKLDIYV